VVQHTDQRTSQLAEKLTERIRSMQSVAVAFSGGVDSAVVAKAAVLALGDSAVAVTSVSPSLAPEELIDARQQARLIGIRHVELKTSEFEKEQYRRNHPDRCYFCKDTLYSAIEHALPQLGVTVVLNGTNKDDLGDYRPGLRAASEYQVRSPLAEEGLSKTDVRALAAFWCLPSADKPAAPCLASRIAYGVEVTEVRVARIAEAESFLRGLLQCRELRVREEAAELARIEVPLSILPVITEPQHREAISSRLRSLGFRAVTLDLEGFRSGSMNEVLVSLRSSGPALSSSAQIGDRHEHR
jgi:uncharacterized protein